MTTVQHKIRDLIVTWQEATMRGDTDAVLALVHEDAVFLQPNQNPMRGRAALANAMQNRPKDMHLQITSTLEDVAVVGTLAHAVCWLEVRVQHRGQEVLRSGRTLSVFEQQENGTWLLLRDANMLMPQP